MRKTIAHLIENYTSKGFTVVQARNLTAQQIILTKIERSKFVDSVLLKGGVVMYNLSQEQRRTTTDLDFDFLRYNIADDRDIKLFVNVLNKYNPEYQVLIDGAITTLHQQDYRGKRVKLLIKDDSSSIRFKLDIGVHTLLAINQEKMCFSFGNGRDVYLLVNPPEQIFAEKLFSLAKIGPVSVRFKDVDDMYYLINNKILDINVVRKCLELLTIQPVNEIQNIQDVINRAVDVLENTFFIEGYHKSNEGWLKQKYETVLACLLEYIYRI